MDHDRRTLAGRYRLEEVIGRGGMSTVYRASDEVLDRIVAVKVLLAALAEGDPVNVTRFEREARAAASLAHPAVVAVYDTGIEEALRYIVMEYVQGRSLDAILRDGPLDPVRAVHLGAGVADALAAAHAAGLIHRDIKPGNVMVSGVDSVKVLDFGIARAVDATAVTKTASLVGTVPYMAPEVALGEHADERSDIYSLGCLLYSLLTGSPPFMADNSPAILNQHVNADPRSLREVSPEVPPALDALVMQMLAKAREDRPQSAAEVRDRLHGSLREAPTLPAADPAGAPAAAAAEETGATRRLEEAEAPAVSAEAEPARHRRRWGAAAVLAAAIVAALVAIAILALTSGGTPQRTSPSSRSTSSGSALPTPTHSQPATTAPPPVQSTQSPTSSSPPPGHGGAPPGQTKPPPGPKAKGGKPGQGG